MDGEMDGWMGGEIDVYMYGYMYVSIYMCVYSVTQWYLPLCNLTTLCGILQARMLE